jgi:hypothetical protein
MNQWLLRLGIALIVLHAALLSVVSFGPVVLIYLIAGPHWYSLEGLPGAFETICGKGGSILGISAGVVEALYLVTYAACIAWAVVVWLLVRRSPIALTMHYWVGGLQGSVSISAALAFSFQSHNFSEVVVCYGLLAIVFTRKGVRDLFSTGLHLTGRSI